MKRLTKKGVSVLLAVIMLTGGFNFLSAFAADAGIILAGECGAEGDTVNFAIYNDGRLVISGEGKIKDYAFASPISLLWITPPRPQNFVTKLIISEGITEIGDYAFTDCYSLETMILPDSLTYIGRQAFLRTAWYEKYPDGMIYLGKCAYIYKGIILKDTVVTIKDGTISISSEAFYWNPYTWNNINGLKEVNIPESVKKIGDDAFYYCESLVSFNVAEKNPNYSSADGVLYDKQKEILIHYPAGNSAASFTVSAGVKEIRSRAFERCYNLTELMISEGVISIGKNAFYNCHFLKSVTLPDSLESIGESAFFRCYDLEYITIPDKVKTIEYSTFEGCSSLKYIIIPNSITFLDEFAFNRNIMLCGSPGSYAEEYATKYDRRFAAVLPDWKTGDVDGDGEITAADARLALRASSRLTTLSNEGVWAADINKDGSIDTSEARKILRVSSRLDAF